MYPGAVDCEWCRELMGDLPLSNEFLLDAAIALVVPAILNMFSRYPILRVLSRPVASVSVPM